VSVQLVSVAAAVQWTADLDPKVFTSGGFGLRSVHWLGVYGLRFAAAVDALNPGLANANTHFSMVFTLAAAAKFVELQQAMTLNDIN
jgi:hypothetical protein